MHSTKGNLHSPCSPFRPDWQYIVQEENYIKLFIMQRGHRQLHAVEKRHRSACTADSAAAPFIGPIRGHWIPWGGKVESIGRRLPNTAELRAASIGTPYTAPTAPPHGIDWAQMRCDSAGCRRVQSAGIIQVAVMAWPERGNSGSTRPGGVFSCLKCCGHRL